MTSQPAWVMPLAGRRRQVWLGVIRSVASIIVLVGLYYRLPLDHLASVPLWVTLVVGLLVLFVGSAWQLRRVIGARYPGIQAVVALAITVPLFLLLFASVYYVMAKASPANFNTHPLTRTDTLYFTITTFSTVGFGDITAVSTDARLLVTIQVILDLLVLGLGFRVFIGAVHIARQTQSDPAGSAASPEPPQQEPG
jgi:voltage-gated potassium channel